MNPPNNSLTVRPDGGGSTSENFPNSNINTLLERLDGVESRANSRWIAKCPAHDDRTPSLAVRETVDRRILIHCFAGCTALDVVSAVGMDMADLQPRLDRDHYHPFAFARAEIAQRRKLEEEIRHHSLVCAMAESDLKKGKNLSPEDRITVRNSVRFLQEVGND